MASSAAPKPTPEVAEVELKVEPVSGTLFVPNTRSLGLNERAQELLFDAVKKEVPGAASITLTEVKHTIGKGFEVSYQAAFVKGQAPL